VRGKVLVTVVWKVVRAGGGRATGDLRVRAAGRTMTTELRRGKARVRLGVFPRGKRIKVTGVYGGDERTQRDRAVVRLRVR
jgi:hypothetical protein